MADSKPKEEENSSPFAEMFEGFNKELVEHQERRERIIKASRDITAASKKIIFTLQRVRSLGQPVPAFVHKTNAQHWETIEKQYKAVTPDLQGLNAYRYPQITWGSQEFMEALSFQHYLETQTLITYAEAKAKIASLSDDGNGNGNGVVFAPEDYVLGIFDMTGELMRFSITSMATNGALPSGKSPKSRTKQEPDSEDKMDLDTADEVKPRNVLQDLRELRLQLEMLEVPYGSRFNSEVDKKMSVMRQSVDKVEKAFYSLTVRGKERPKGWRPDADDGRRPEVESY